MAQTVQLLGTLVHDPRLIVLDEPFSGLDPINQGKLERLIRERAANGVTVIFSTHVIAHAERLCERNRHHRGRQGRLRRTRGRKPALGFARSSACAPAHATDRGVRRSPQMRGAEHGEWVFELP
jgi:ABC-2 type transport system ATP-binding protein